MSDLNYLRIAQILGGTVSEVQSPSFGVLGAASISAERFRLVKQPAVAPQITREQYPIIAEAFEEVRDGYEPDRVLVDPVLSKKFFTMVRKRGVTASNSLIAKKLQAFRKDKGYGITLSKTTREGGLEPEPFFYAAELGFVQLSYRRPVSVDDVITDSEVGDEFVALCKAIKPDGRAIDFKWAALRLRKMRSFDRARTEKLLAVEPEEIEQQLRLVGTLDRIATSDVPTGKGIFSLAEQNGADKYLYVGATRKCSIREAFEPFRSARPFMAVAGPFWQPKLSDINLRVAVVKRNLLGASSRDISLRLIEERHPLFNIPVHIGDDGEADED